MAVVMFAALSACAGGAPQDAGRAAAPVTITWLASSLTDSYQDPRQSLIDAFEQAYPLIRVELVSAPTNTDENRAMLQDAIAGKGAAPSPDVYSGDVIWPAQFAEAGLALPLDRYLPASFWSRFEPEFVKAARYNGRIYAVPFFASQGVLLYRKDLVPNPPRTWGELVQVAHLLLARQRVQYGFVWQGAPYEGLTCVWTEIAADAAFAAHQAPYPGMRMDSPSSIRALTFMRTLLTSGVSPDAVTAFREPQALRAFENGQAAFLRTWENSYASAATLSGSWVRGKVGIAPLPTFDGERGARASTFGGWDLYVNPHTTHLAEVLSFIKWMTDFPAQYALTQYSVIPTNAAVRSDPTVKDNPVFAALKQMRPVRRPSATPLYPQVSSVIYGEVYRALRGTISPGAALREAQREIHRVIASGQVP